MIHPRDWELIVSWEYSSDFEVGECWGYNRFYWIEGIIEEGFIFEEDKSLRLKFFVRASTYSQHSKDLKWYIEELEKKVKT